MLSNIQRSLVPRRTASRFHGVEIAHHWEPLDEIGGDYLYYERIGSDNLFTEIGDVLGHGTHAGLVMTSLHGLLFGLRQKVAPVEQMLSSANEFLCRLRPAPAAESAAAPASLGQLPLSSMFLLCIDFSNRVLIYSNAGHPPPIYIAHNSHEHSILSLSTGGPILGALPGATYRAGTLRPAAGDTILFFTDGLSEATNEAGEEFGSGMRLSSILTELHEQQPKEIVATIKTSLASFRGSVPLRDDLSLAVLQFKENW